MSSTPRAPPPYSAEMAVNQVAKGQRVHMSAPAIKSSNDDSVSDFLESYMRKKGISKRKPQEKFNKPTITSHDYGWRGANLERFGGMMCRLR